MDLAGCCVELFLVPIRIIFFLFFCSPKLGYSPPTPKSGHYSSTLDMGTEYQVRLRSSIGKNYSEPAIKYFKDCEEIKRNPSEKTNEL